VIKDKNRNIMSVDKAIINFRIQRINERKGELNNENNKSIEFRYHMNKDKPEIILQELVFFLVIVVFLKWLWIFFKIEQNKIKTSEIFYLNRAIQDKCRLLKIEMNYNNSNENSIDVNTLGFASEWVWTNMNHY
jgi:hypothetical protein